MIESLRIGSNSREMGFSENDTTKIGFCSGNNRRIDPILPARAMVRGGGFEPPTFGSSVRHLWVRLYLNSHFNPAAFIR